MNLKNFYQLDNKLLYISSAFIGIEPLQSSALYHDMNGHSGKAVRVDKFDLDTHAFTLITTYFNDTGHVKNYRRFEVFKDGEALLQYETGEKGFGSFHTSGQKFVVKGTDAFLLASGEEIRYGNLGKPFRKFVLHGYYFFWFRNVVFPVATNMPGVRINLPQQKTFTQEEIEPYRIVNWEAQLPVGSSEWHIRKSAVPGFFPTLWRKDGLQKFRIAENFDALSKIEISYPGGVPVTG
ncbi:MAG: hypothetical protein JWQ27_104 [Ferruginibacter sp.]|nr:hypothetical protein [Ferruginibacter sp.]